MPTREQAQHLLDLIEDSKDAAAHVPSRELQRVRANMRRKAPQGYRLGSIEWELDRLLELAQVATVAARARTADGVRTADVLAQRLAENRATFLERWDRDTPN